MPDSKTCMPKSTCAFGYCIIYSLGGGGRGGVNRLTDEEMFSVGHCRFTSFFEAFSFPGAMVAYQPLLILVYSQVFHSFTHTGQAKLSRKFDSLQRLQKDNAFDPP